MIDERILRGHYRLTATIGEGAQGTVYRATDLRSGRDVAIKSRSMSDPTLFAEARVLHELRPHPSLPRLHEDFTEDDTLYLVMDWIDGPTVGDLVRALGALDLATAIDVLAPVAAALDHLHGHRAPIVHGDVKPANIIRAHGTGDIVLVDLGVAGSAHRGSPGYRAPESASGPAGAPADIYALAATAYTLLTGRVPSPGPFALLPRLGAARSEHVRRAIEWGMQVMPERRPQHARALVAAIGDAAG